MIDPFKRLVIASLVVAVPDLASAHAFLDRAVPGVGATVTGSPDELQLGFTEGVVAALCRVRVAAAGGGAVGASKPTKDAGNANLLHVRLARPLAPGTYVVSWRAVAVDTHTTSGSYKFTVAR